MTKTGGARRARTLSTGRAPTVRTRVRPRGVRRWVPVAARSVGIAVLIPIAGMGFLYLRLLFGPIKLGFLARPIESAIAEELAGPQVRIEGVALGLNDRGLLQFDLKNVKVTDQAGKTLVTAPSVAVSLSREALFRGRIAVESLDLMAPRLLLFYAEDGSLSLKFSAVTAEADGAGPPAPPAELTPPSTEVASPGATPVPSEPEGMLGRIDIVKVLAEASARARRQEHASAYLREVGLRSATVVIDNGRKKTVWQVPQVDLDLDHRRTRSSIAGHAKIQSADGPWELTFRSFESVRNKELKLSIVVQGLVPHGLAQTFPQLLPLDGVDVPISADAQLQLSTVGELLGGKITIEAASGNIALPGPKATPMRIVGGHLQLTYDGAARAFEIGSTELSWGEGHVQLAGTVAYTAQSADGPRWAFDIKATEGSVAADPRAPVRLPIDELAATGYLAPEQARIVLDRFILRAGGAEATAKGELSDIGGTVQARIDGKIGAMPVTVFKTLWPSWLAPQARIWAAQKVVGGEVLGGTFKIVRGAAHARADWTPVSETDRFSLTIEGSNLALALMDGWPALEVPRALLSVENTSVELSIPEATQAAADGRKLTIKGGFTVDLGDALPRQGHIALKGNGPLSLVLDILAHEAPSAMQNTGVDLSRVDGKIDGNLTINVPLDPQPQFQNATVEGKVRVADAKVPQALGPHDVQGVNVSVDITPSAFEADGKFLIGNVPATLTWQHVYGAPPERQPPLRIASTLYEAERNELGLDINDLVHGQADVEVAVTQDAKGEHQVHLRADLANAELALDSLGWRKPVGRRAVFEFDVAKGTGSYPIELRNVRLDGDGIAIAGWMGMGEDMHVREYRFPQFSLDVVSNFEAHGKLRSDNVWDITAKGPTYDGRDLFKSFFFVRDQKLEKGKPGIDLHAEFDTVLGFFQTSARNVRLSMQKRGGKLNQLDMRCGLAGGKQLEAVVRPDPARPYHLTARSNDAGQVFKLVGFLPHAVGGDLNLEVNLEGRGPGERTGTLSAAHFYLLGDVISNDLEPGSGSRKRNVAREKIEFDTLRAPFSVSAGQFRLQDASIDGPLMSATMNGRVDFRTRKVQITGTFTPLSALNKILSDVPLVGDIVTGPKREGMFAWNFGVQGGLENPQVVVNPMSGVAPGFTREFFPILPDEPAAPQRKGKRSDSGTRSSSSLVMGPSDNTYGTETDVSQGWSSSPSKKY